MSLRARLGGRRALSWQAVVIGDVLIVALATILAASSAGDRPPIDAAIDVFAITMATAVVAAAYTAVAHLTIFRNRADSPLPVPVAVGFHLSIGVMFLVGFALGAALLSIPPLGGSILFSVAVLIGGLLVCLPTTLLLDHSDRYRDARSSLIDKLADLERLRISEWSLRRTLRTLLSAANDGPAQEAALERLDALDLSEGTTLSTDQWWAASLDHHQSAPAQIPDGRRMSAPVDVDSKYFSKLVRHQISKDFPPIRWSQQLTRVFDESPRPPLAVAVLAAFMTLLLLTPLMASSRALSLSLPLGLGVYLIIRFSMFDRRGRRFPPSVILAFLCLWALIASAVWSAVLAGAEASSVNGFLVSLLATVLAVVSATLITSWIGSVIDARDKQVRMLEDVIEYRRSESAAVLASLASVVTQMADLPSLSGSAAMAACASGVRRVQQERDVVHARRIIDWTQSVISSPQDTAFQNLEARIEEVVQPWRALAEISVHCRDEGIDISLHDDVVGIVDEAVRNACRHGEAQSIVVNVSGEPLAPVRIEIVDDGNGPDPGPQGLGFERFASVGRAGFEMVRLDPGTRVTVTVDPDWTGGDTA